MFKRSPKTECLLELFRQTNGVLTYERLTNEMGEDIEALRPAIATARRMLERDEGIVFECLRKRGYQRLSDAEKVESSDKFSRRIRRNAGGGLQRLAAVSDLAALSNEDQMRAALRKAAFEAIARAAAEKSEEG